uniref:Rac GTPase-activating protein 1 n=1 Tax=Oryzias sinensis TaxID=183150 RepID=A0A8C7ZY68_9TELE
MDSTGFNLQGFFDKLMTHIDLLNDNIEPNFIQMARNFDECRRKWLSSEQELGACKEMLRTAEMERGALEVKLKHARNQVDVEIRRRQKAESDCDSLDRQIQLIRDLLTSEGSTNSIQLSAEQRSALAFLNTNGQFIFLTVAWDQSQDAALSFCAESGLLSFDLWQDWDSSTVRTVRLKKREKRVLTIFANETLVTTTTVTVPANGGPVEAVSTIETVPYWTRSRRKTGKSVSFTFLINNSQPSTPQSKGAVRPHEFVSKTVIKPESCVPCGKRIKFGKISLKCRDCRVVSHLECRERCPLPCIPNLGGTPVKIGEGVLADYVSDSSPMIPSLVVHCISEIEQRGLHEAGLYRLSGADRTVKELKEKFLRSKTVPVLSKVDDIHAITGLLKDFLRNLKEPLLTFHLNRAFMDAAEVSDDDNSKALMYQTITDLPQPNRDTLAFLVIHLQRVADSLDTKMDISNLARVFGPTIVGHAVPNPEPMTILQDTKRQPKVVERLLSLPVDYWAQFVNSETEQPNLDQLIIENANCYATPERVSILGPLTTPEHQLSKTPSSSSLTQRMRSTLTPRFGSKSKSAVGFSHQGKFFASPLLK